MENEIKSQLELAGFPKTDKSRAYDARRDNDQVLDFSITLKDIDKSIQYYFNNIIRPTVVENESVISVPVIYMYPERWKSMQVDGFLRDKEGKLQVPIIGYRRTGKTRIRDLSSKVDANFPQVHMVRGNEWSAKHPYEPFDDKHPSKNTYYVVVPDWVDITYDIMIWTNTIGQMNELEEAITYAEGSYWGDPNKFQFLTRIDDMTPEIELEAGKDRLVRLDMTLILHGYLIPKSVNKALSQTLVKTPSIKKIQTDLTTD